MDSTMFGEKLREADTRRERYSLIWPWHLIDYQSRTIDHWPWTIGIATVICSDHEGDKSRLNYLRRQMTVLFCFDYFFEWHVWHLWQLLYWSCELTSLSENVSTRTSSDLSSDQAKIDLHCNWPFSVWPFVLSVFAGTKWTRQDP